MVGVQESRMVVYVRQENEEIYTPLHLVPPNVQAIRYTKWNLIVGFRVYLTVIYTLNSSVLVYTIYIIQYSTRQ